MKKALRRLGWLMLVVLILVTVASEVLHTEWGRTQLARRISSEVSARMEGEFLLEGISGWIPFDVKVKRLAMTKPGGLTWLELEDIAAKPNLRSLLDRRLLVDRVEVGRATYRQPPPSAKKKKKPFSWNAIPSGIVSDLRIGALKIVSESGPLTSPMAVRGEAEHRDAAGGTRLSLAVSHEWTEGFVSVRRSGPNAPWASRISLLAKPDWTIDATTEGWGGQAQVASPTEGELVSGFQVVRTTDVFRVDLTPDVTLTPRRVPGWLADLTGYHATGQCALIKPKGGAWSIDGARVEVGPHTAVLEIALPDKERGWSVEFDATLRDLSWRDRSVRSVVAKGMVRAADGIAIEVQALPSGFEGLPADVVAGLGAEPVVQAAVQVTTGRVDVSRFSVRGDLMELNGEGVVSTGPVNVDVTWQAELRELQRLPSLETRSWAVPVQPVTLSGDVGYAGKTAFPLRMTAQIDGVETERLSIDRVGIAYEHGTGVVAETAIHYGPATLRVSGELDAGGPRAELRLEELPFAEVPGWTEVTGSTAGSLSIGGTWVEPTIAANVRVTDLKSTVAGAEGFKPVDGTAEVEFSQGQLDAQARFHTQGEDQLDVAANFPLALQLAPWKLELPAEGEGGVSVRGRLDLDALNALPVMAEQQLAGILELDVTAKGTPSAPRFAGSGRIRQGRYEHFIMGTDLRNLELALEAEDQSLTIRSLKAEDATGGTLNGTGQLKLLPQENFPFQFDFQLRRIQLLANDLLTAVADGGLRLEGTPKRMQVGGALAFAPVRIQIPAYLPLGKPGYTVVDPQRPEAPVTASRRAKAGRGIELDVQVSVPARMTVRGRGLDSEWGGQVKVGGSAAEPRITGQIQSVRGRFNFFGQPFTLTESSVRFVGASPPRPSLDINFERSRSERVAYLKVGGSTAAPVFELSSNPPLPADELLPHVLFGKDIRDVSPLQAVRIAQAARALQGAGSAFDFMGHAQRLLAVDQLNIEQADEGEGVAKVTAGKYLSDRVYIEGQNQGGPGSGRLTLEVELTPRISLETDIEAEMNQGVGLKFKRNF